MRFHPTHPTYLLSGSTDGLVNIYDTTISDEDDAVHQTINHESSIHHAGFMAPNLRDVYGLSHDETFSVYSLTDPEKEENNEEEPAPIVFGDVRSGLECEYVIDVLRERRREEMWMAVGNHS